MGEEKKGFFKRLVAGLTKTRDNMKNWKRFLSWEI